jgi:selenocysteine lyase/cysteine desulfurase
MDAAVRYLEDLGRLVQPTVTSRRDALVAATEAIRSYEAQLSQAMLQALANAQATVYGLTDPNEIPHRTPTLCFNLPGTSPARVTDELTKESGAVRASLVHYNTLAEVHEFANALTVLTG